MTYSKFKEYTTTVGRVFAYNMAKQHTNKATIGLWIARMKKEGETR